MSKKKEEKTVQRNENGSHLQSEDKFRAIFEGANDGILVADAKTKRFVLANPKICEMTGYSLEELARLSVNEIHPKKDLPYVNGQFAKQVQGKLAVAKDIPVLRKDRKVVYCDVNSKLVKIGGQQYLVGFFRDITERKKDEEVLKTSEEKYRAVVENATDQIFLLDDSLKFISLNSTVAKLVGRPANELVGKSISKVFPKETSIQFSKNCREVFRTGKTKTIEEKISVNGRDFYSSTVLSPVKNSKGDVSSVMGIVRDITERRKAEESLRDSVDEWSRTFDSISDMIFIQDRDFIIRKANSAFYKSVRLKPDEVIGKKCHEVVHKAGRPWKNCPFVMTIRDSKPHTEEVDDPKIGVALLVTTSPIFDSNGKLSGSVHIARDISDAKKASEELRKRNEELERFNRLAVGRELKMIELKKRIKELESELAGRQVHA